MSTEFISRLDPPGDKISGYDRSLPSDQQADTVPHVFIEAMGVREAVFVKEQGVSLENELDADDPRSFHWVAYASVGAPPEAANASDGARDAQRKASASRVPVGVIRLVPPPHPDHPSPGSEHQIDNSEAEAIKDEGTNTFVPSNVDIRDERIGREEEREGGPYIKLGRLAVLPEFRHLGLAKLLVPAALEFAAHNPDKVTPPIDPAEAEALRQDNKPVPQRWNGRVLVHAQTSVQRVWARFGFVKDESMGEWMEEGIMHVGMWRNLEVVDRKTGLFR